ncbi:MAG: hypothetical protein H6Q03_2585 [Acidobacteria bacterium]|nr:hypothetical protein [Acidobacteriota bacterium]
MKDFLVFLAFLAAWILLQRFLLPRLGVPT